MFSKDSRGAARHRTLGLLIAALLFIGAPLVVAANGVCAPIRPQDELWLVSCRGNACGPDCGAPQSMEYWRYDSQKAWVKSSLAEFKAGDNPSVVTSIFVHGNRIAWDEAFTTGWSVYRTLTSCLDERPLRLVIWSWPSEKVGGPVADAQIKACRTEPAGHCLAWFIDQIDPHVPVSLLGHSFGARVITGSLQLLGGGTLGGQRMATRTHATRDVMNVVLLVAALDTDWLSPGHYHGAAMSQIAQLHLVNNGCDALLMRYHRIESRRSGRQALGYTGLPRGWVAATDWAKVTQVDACCYVDKRHLLEYYLQAQPLMAGVRPVLLFMPTANPTGEPVATQKNTQIAVGSR